MKQVLVSNAVHHAAHEVQSHAPGHALVERLRGIDGLRRGGVERCASGVHELDHEIVSVHRQSDGHRVLPSTVFHHVREQLLDGEIHREHDRLVQPMGLGEVAHEIEQRLQGTQVSLEGLHHGPPREATDKGNTLRRTLRGGSCHSSPRRLARRGPHE